MPTPLSIEGRLLAGLELREMPVSEFAIVAGKENIRAASKTKLNEYFRDAAPMPHDTARACSALWEEIEALCREVEPLMLDLRDGEKVHQWLQARRREELSIVVRKSDAFVRGFLSALAGQPESK